VRLRLLASISLSKRIQNTNTPPAVRFARHEPSPLPPHALRPGLRHRNGSLVVTKILYAIYRTSFVIRFQSGRRTIIIIEIEKSPHVVRRSIVLITLYLYKYFQIKKTILLGI